jgi:hypothetical protein
VAQVRVEVRNTRIDGDGAAGQFDRRRELPRLICDDAQQVQRVGVTRVTRRVGVGSAPGRRPRPKTRQKKRRPKPPFESCV